MSEIVLLNAVHELRKILDRPVRGEEAHELLYNRGITFYTIGKGKGGRVMVTKEVGETLSRFNWNVASRRRRRTKEEGEAAAPTVIVQEHIIERIDPEWKADIEGMVLDENTRVDTLHKAVEAMHATYTRLVKLVDPKANLPEPPPLPRRYRHKIILIGGEQSRIVPHLETLFPSVRFVHIGGYRSQLSATPEGDLILLFSKYVGHQPQAQAEKAYGRNRIERIGGGVSSAESVINLFLHQKEKSMEEAQS